MTLHPVMYERMRRRVVFFLAALCLLAAGICAHASTADDLSAKFADALHKGRESVEYTFDRAEMARQKRDGFRDVYYAAARNGLVDMQLSYRDDGLIRITDFRRAEYAFFCDNDAQLKDALGKIAGHQRRGVYLMLKDRYFAAMKPDFKALYNTAAMSGLGDVSFRYSDAGCYVILDDYTPVDHYRVCDTDKDVAEAFRTFSKTPVEEFRLMCTRSYFDSFRGDYGKLRYIAGRNGVMSFDMSYQEGYACFIISNMEMAKNGYRCESDEDLRMLIDEAIADFQEEVDLLCSAKYFRDLQKREDATFEKMFVDLPGYSWTSRDQACTYEFHLKLRPGMRILGYYLGRGNITLDAREAAAYDVARGLAGEASKQGSDLAKEKYIYDELCRRVRYYIDDDSEEDDNAIGALLNGMANCDGYSDAFYLIANMCGIETRCVSGDTIGGSEEGHMWNAVRLNGGWRLVDVTWGDDADGSIHYLWLNAGADITDPVYMTTDDSVRLCRETDASLRFQRDFICTSRDDIAKAFKACRADHTRDFAIFAIGTGCTIDDVRDIMSRCGIYGAFSYNSYDTDNYLSLSFRDHAG